MESAVFRSGIERVMKELPGSIMLVLDKEGR